MTTEQEGRWTREPPTEDGWYWERAPRFPAYYFVRKLCSDEPLSPTVERWSVRIEEPPTS